MVERIQNVRFRVTKHEPNLDGETEARVEELWREAEALGKTNGHMTAMHHYELISGQLRISAFIAEYKLFWAQYNDSELSTLVEPIAVTGLVRDSDGRFLLGQRSDNNTQYQGCWEFPPSGGLNPTEAKIPDGLEAAMRREFKEEIALDETAIRGIIPIGLMYDSADHVYNVAHLINLHSPFPEGYRLLNHDDYTEERIVSMDDVRGLAAITPSMVTSSVMDMLELLG